MEGIYESLCVSDATPDEGNRGNVAESWIRRQWRTSWEEEMGVHDK